MSGLVEGMVVDAATYSSGYSFKTREVTYPYFDRMPAGKRWAVIDENDEPIAWFATSDEAYAAVGMTPPPGQVR